MNSMEKFNAQAQASIDLLDLNRAQERVNEILAPKGPVEVPAVQRPQRKKRSDAGVPKPKKVVPAKGGVLTVEQVTHIDFLRESWSLAKACADTASENLNLAMKAFYDYLDELTIKEKQK